MTIIFAFFFVGKVKKHIFASHLTINPVGAKSESVKNIGMHNKDNGHG
jgi:hypothetical protein